MCDSSSIWGDGSDVPGFDEGVYREKCGGLRIIGNCKAVECKCKGAQHCQVPHIGNSKRVNVGRPYTFYNVYNEDGSINRDLTRDIKESTYLQVALTRIRQFGPKRSDFKKPENCPHPSSDQESKIKRKKRPRKGIGRVAAASELESNRFSENIESMRQFGRLKVFLTPEDGIYQEIENYLQQGSFHPTYKSVNVTSIFTNHKKTYFVVNVDGEGCHYCLNKGASHTSNTVFFYINKDCQISQRCHSKKKTERKHGTCEKWSSPPKQLPIRLQNQIEHSKANVLETFEEFTHRQQLALEFVQLYERFGSPNPAYSSAMVKRIFGYKFVKDRIVELEKGLSGDDVQMEKKKLD